MLVRLGLEGRLFYIALVPLGIAVAVLLFGVLKSYAAYKGQVSGGSLEVIGSIVVFLLVVILGFGLVPNPTPFALTVFVHGERGRQDLVLRNEGAVLIDIGGDRRRASIGDLGQAFFASIPPNFRGQSVPVSVDADGYEVASGKGYMPIASDNLYLLVRPKEIALSGYVKAADGEPILGATVSVGNQHVTTDSRGFFTVSLWERTQATTDAAGIGSRLRGVGERGDA